MENISFLNIDLVVYFYKTDSTTPGRPVPCAHDVNMYYILKTAFYWRYTINFAFVDFFVMTQL